MTEPTDLPPTTAPEPKRRRGWRLPLLAFLAGTGAMGYGLTQTETGKWALGASGVIPPVTESGGQEAQLPVAPAPLIGQAPAAPDMTQRIAELEARLARMESMGGNVGNAGRAEGLLVAFASRRAIERGLALGYIEGELTSHFGGTQPRAVGAIIAASRAPVTRAQLLSQLAELRPVLAGGGPDEGWWDAIKRNLSDLIVVRESGTQPVAASARVERAIALVEGGQVGDALAEISRLPERDKAGDWMAKARRYVEAERALDLLEAAAISNPQANIVAPAPPPPPAILTPEPAPTQQGSTSSF